MNLKIVYPRASIPLGTGNKIPQFKGFLQSGLEISSDDLRTKKVILYFYPQDNTPTCTEEACNLRDNYQRLLKKGYTIYGVSPDSIRKHTNFIKKFNLPFDLISDPDLKIIKLFGVWGPKKLFGREYDGVLRTTFIIDHGIVTEVINEVHSKQHADQILKS
jgi:peroxiredoxin Q/BCP